MNKYFYIALSLKLCLCLSENTRTLVKQNMNRSFVTKIVYSSNKSADKIINEHY